MHYIIKAFAILCFFSACNRSTAPEPSSGTAHDNVVTEASAPAQTAEERSPVVETPTEDNEAGAADPTVQTRVAKGMGTENLARLLGAKTAIVARLGAENPRVVDKTILTDPRRIGGFPIASDERTLSSDETSELARVVTNDEDYLDIRRRCLNKTHIGARFGDPLSPERIEVELGRPCDQLVFYWLDEGAVKTWGSVVSPAMSEAFEKIVSGN